jgi:hypothetical protein
MCVAPYITRKGATTVGMISAHRATVASILKGRLLVAGAGRERDGRWPELRSDFDWSVFLELAIMSKFYILERKNRPHFLIDSFSFFNHAAQRQHLEEAQVRRRWRVLCGAQRGRAQTPQLGAGADLSSRRSPPTLESFMRAAERRPRLAPCCSRFLCVFVKHCSF